MPIHDWTRVSDGTFHAFHVSWVSELQESLNSGLLPEVLKNSAVFAWESMVPSRGI